MIFKKIVVVLNSMLLAFFLFSTFSCSKQKKSENAPLGVVTAQSPRAVKNFDGAYFSSLKLACTVLDDKPNELRPNKDLYSFGLRYQGCNDSDEQVFAPLKATLRENKGDFVYELMDSSDVVQKKFWSSELLSTNVPFQEVCNQLKDITRRNVVNTIQTSRGIIQFQVLASSKDLIEIEINNFANVKNGASPEYEMMNSFRATILTTRANNYPIGTISKLYHYEKCPTRGSKNAESHSIQELLRIDR